MSARSGNAKVSKSRPYIISPDEPRISSGKMQRAILSSTLPIAMSIVVARMLWSVSPLERSRSVWPPETRSERNGKEGVGSMLPEARAETSRGVNACACIWFTPSSGTCHATAKPLAVLSPASRLERIPGPRVTETKSGFFLSPHFPSAENTEMVTEGSSGEDREAGGKAETAFATSNARFS